MTDPREMELRDTRRDDPARFLRELRKLRSQAGLDYAELAARAHYPCDAIKAAEAGPGLPDLPVLSAYVRGCGGTVAEWEERWRAVTDSPASPLLTARGTGWSEAADAGARVSGVSFAADEEDSDRVIAALNRVADGMAATSATSAPSGAAAAGNGDAWTPAARTGDADVWTPAARAGDADVRTPAARDTDVWTPATGARAADLWTPAGDTEPWTTATRSGDEDVWSPATRTGAADVWTPAARAGDADLWAAAEAVSAPGRPPDSVATQAVPHTRADVDALTTGWGDTPRPADAATRRPAASAGMPPAATSKTAQPRPSQSSRTALAVYAGIVLLLVIILIALFG